MEDFYPTGPWLTHILDLVDPPVGRAGFSLDRVTRIKIITNDAGPFEDDAFWKFETPDGDAYYPMGADPDGDLLQALQQLSGFDNEAVIKAMTSVQNNVFVIWEKSGH